MAKVSRQLPPRSKGRAKGQQHAGIVNAIRQISKPEGGMKIVLYGRSGTGKTTVACTWPKPLLLIGAEDGRQSVYNVKGVDYVAIHTADEARDVIAYQAEVGKYKTLVMDSVTSLQDLVLKQVLDVEQLPAQLAWGTASQKQWGDTALIVKEVLRSLTQLSCNVVFTGLEREFNAVEESGEVLMPYVSLSASPSVSGYLAPSVDYYCQTFLREQTVKVQVKLASGKTRMSTANKIQFCLRTGPHPVYTTKFRVLMGQPLPEVIVNPTYEKVLAVAEGAGE